MPPLSSSDHLMPPLFLVEPCKNSLEVAETSLHRSPNHRCPCWFFFFVDSFFFINILWNEQPWKKSWKQPWEKDITWVVDFSLEVLKSLDFPGFSGVDSELRAGGATARFCWKDLGDFHHGTFNVVPPHFCFLLGSTLPEQIINRRILLACTLW